MLEQIQKDWHAAITSSTRKLIRHEQIEVKGEKITKSQIVEFQFRGIKAYMELELFHGDENQPADKRRYRNTVQIPSTNKQVVIYPREWSSKVEKMMAILVAFTKGREHENRVAIRRQQAIARETQKFVKSCVSGLEKTTFNKDEKAFILKWLDSNADPKNMSWIKVLLDVLVKYHAYITGRGLIEYNFDLGNEINSYVPNCYDTCARIINASTHPNGAKFLPMRVANILFLEEKTIRMPGEENDPRKVSVGIYVMRTMFAMIWDVCTEASAFDRSRLFVYICEFLGAYYAYATGIPVDKQCAITQERFIKKKNRDAARRINGETGNRGQRFRERPQGPILNLGDAYGDVLEQAVSRSKQDKRFKPDEYEEEDEEKYNKVKKSKPVVIVPEVEDDEPEVEEEIPDTTEEVDDAPIEETPVQNLGAISDILDKADLL